MVFPWLSLIFHGFYCFSYVSIDLRCCDPVWALYNIKKEVGWAPPCTTSAKRGTKHEESQHCTGCPCAKRELSEFGLSSLVDANMFPVNCVLCLEVGKGGQHMRWLAGWQGGTQEWSGSTKRDSAQQTERQNKERGLRQTQPRYSTDRLDRLDRQTDGQTDGQTDETSKSRTKKAHTLL